MPNHCESDLTIRGDPTTLTQLYIAAQGLEGIEHDEYAAVILLSAQSFIPLPPEALTNELKCQTCSHTEIGPASGEISWKRCPNGHKLLLDWYNRAGYDWCIGNWGTKWGLYDVKMTGDDFESGEVSYTFRTAWSPPVPVIKAMSEKFPTLRFDLRYYESGGGYQGQAVFEAGATIKEWEGAYHGSRGG